MLSAVGGESMSRIERVLAGALLVAGVACTAFIARHASSGGVAQTLDFGAPSQSAAAAPVVVASPDVPGARLVTRAAAARPAPQQPFQLASRPLAVFRIAVKPAHEATASGKRVATPPSAPVAKQSAPQPTAPATPAPTIPAEPAPAPAAPVPAPAAPAPTTPAPDPTDPDHGHGKGRGHGRFKLTPGPQPVPIPVPVTPTPTPP